MHRIPQIGNLVFPMWSMRIHSAVEDDVPPQTSFKSSTLRLLDISRKLLLSKVNTTSIQPLEILTNSSSFQSYATRSRTPCRKSHPSCVTDIKLQKIALKTSWLEEKCPLGSHFGEWRKSSKTVRGRFLWAVWILCAPKMILPVSQQMLVVSSASSTHRRRLPRRWMNQKRVSGYLVKNTLQVSLTSWAFQCGFWEECFIGL